MTTDSHGDAVGTPTGRSRQFVAGVGVLFWTWLLARWAYHNTLLDSVTTAVGLPGFIRSDLGVSQREPWVPAGPFEATADSIGGLAADLGPAAVLAEWLAWPFELAALAVSAEPAFAAGAFVTIYLTVIPMALGLFIALPTAVARIYGGPISSRLSLAFTELVRGTPLLAQLFFFYFALPLAGVIDDIWLMDLSGAPRTAAVVAIVAFTINSAAYQAEYIRAALQSVDAGQLTAGRAVGLSKIQGIRHIVLPQGLRYAIPGWTNEFIYLLKYTSLAAFITVPELFRRAQNIGSDTFQYTDIYLIVALWYIALVLTTSLIMGKLETRLAVPGVGRAGRE